VKRLRRGERAPKAAEIEQNPEKRIAVLEGLVYPFAGSLKFSLISITYG
jgi:hypothetical protein